MMYSKCMSDFLCNHFLCTKYLQKLYTDFDEFCGEVRSVPGRNGLHFGGDPESFMDPGSFCRILYH